MLNTNGFQEIDKLVEAGIIDINAANDMKGKMMKKTLTDKSIIMPTITEHTRKGKLQYTCMIPASMSRDGKRHQVTGKTRKECEKKWTEIMYDVVENGQTTIPETLSELMEEWLSTRQDIKPQTLTIYHSHYENHIKNEPFAKLKIKNIRLQDCKDIVSNLTNKRVNGAGLGYGTVTRIKCEINMALEYAVAHEYIGANYMRTVTVNQGLCDTSRKRNSMAWSNEELQQLISASNREWQNGKRCRLSAALIAMIFTGCRIGEFCALRWEDFDEENSTLTINKTVTNYRTYGEQNVHHVQAISTTKTAGSTRTIELTDEAVFWLQELKRRQVERGMDTPYIAGARSGRIMSRNSIIQRFKYFCEIAGVDYKPSHTARRTYATMLYDGGVPVSEIAADLGHRSTTTTLNAYYKRRNTNNAKRKNKIFVEAVTAVTAAAETL